MTRINVVPPRELSRQHLVAEYRELPRVFGLARKAAAAGRKPDAPDHYTLGAGHVLFFYTRLGWLIDRQKALIAEMLRRGYHPTHTDTSDLLDGIPPEWIRYWIPDANALAINRARIAERNEGMIEALVAAMT